MRSILPVSGFDNAVAHVLSEFQVPRFRKLKTRTACTCNPKNVTCTMAVDRDRENESSQESKNKRQKNATHTLLLFLALTLATAFWHEKQNISAACLLQRTTAIADSASQSSAKQGLDFTTAQDDNREGQRDVRTKTEQSLADRTTHSTTTSRARARNTKPHGAPNQHQPPRNPNQHGTPEAKLAPNPKKHQTKPRAHRPHQTPQRTKRTWASTDSVSTAPTGALSRSTVRQGCPGGR
eukprot:3940694-Rhodomonas_salina.2